MIDSDDEAGNNNDGLRTSLRQVKCLNGKPSFTTLEHVVFKIYFVLHF